MTRKNHKFEVLRNDSSLVFIDFSHNAALNIRNSVLIEIIENMIRRNTKNVTSSNDHNPMKNSSAFNKKIDINKIKRTINKINSLLTSNNKTKKMK